MTLPKPEPGLVIRYTYLWSREHERGREEGRKDRPCVIILAVTMEDGNAERVLVVPVTSSRPADPTEAMEIPPAIKKSLGLDADQSWIIVSESNDFIWPGPDLRRVGDRPTGPFGYGFLPPRFFAELRRRFAEMERARRSRRVPRTE